MAEKAMRTSELNARQRWLHRLLACCGVTLGGASFEGMWGDALRAAPAPGAARRLTQSQRTSGN